jgi:multiple sugar transport system substrate-binding protein
MWVRAILLAAALMLAPLATRAADLVVWWEVGYQREEDQAVEEVVAAFEQKTGKQVELAFHAREDVPARTQEALAAGRPPDFAWGLWIDDYIDIWARDGKLLDLSAAIGPLKELFDPDAIDQSILFNARTGKAAFYALPVARTTNHLHVWTSLLEQAGFTQTDIPKEWEAFWSFWCDQVQPAVRKALDREDVWGIGLPMSSEAYDTHDQFYQFAAARETGWVSSEGRLVAEDPAVRERLVHTLADYTSIWRKGCTPPDALTWSDAGNNEAFVAQRVVMTMNQSLSIPNALRGARPDDYYKNTATIDWPNDTFGRSLGIHSPLQRGAAFEGGRNPALTLDFVRFLVADGWLAHWLNFARDRLQPTMPALARQPLWLDPGDPHQMRSAMYFVQHPRAPNWAPSASPDRWRHL